MYIAREIIPYLCSNLYTNTMIDYVFMKRHDAVVEGMTVQSIDPSGLQIKFISLFASSQDIIEGIKYYSKLVPNNLSQPS